MALLSVEGVYTDGRVALSEPPEGVEAGARVVVTFLPTASAPTDAPTERAEAARQRRREVGERLLEMMRRGINFGGEKFNREELYEERMDELDRRQWALLHYSQD